MSLYATDDIYNNLRMLIARYFSTRTKAICMVIGYRVSPRILAMHSIIRSFFFPRYLVD